MKKILFFIAMFGSLLVANAAYLENVPVTVTQPDGTKLECFASGDEFYNYLHDAQGFTIIQSPTNGFFVYADLKDGELVPTDMIADRSNPASKLKPHLNISPEKRIERRKAWDVPETMQVQTVRNRETNHGTLNNIVIFIRFNDDSEFTNAFSSVYNMFNTNSSGVSMQSYFDEVSYHQISIPTTFYPAPSGNTILSYRDTQPRSYFEPYNAVTNPNGYNGDSQRKEREHSLLKRAVDYINANGMIPSNLNVDYNNDGNVDNVCFVVRGGCGDWSSLLWPHKWSLYSYNVKINGKRVYTYNFQLADSGGYFSTSTMCHEMNHSLGAPDLYHYSYSGPTPVGYWDLMESNATPPQHMGTYMKYKYGNWIDEIPEITESGVYTLHDISSSTNNCYKMASSVEGQYYVFEYRKKSVEPAIPGSGLLIYRINTAANGNADYNGTTVFDEVYIYRPNGSTTSTGSIYNAYFSEGSGRTSFNSSTNPNPFLIDGTVDNDIRISDISTAGETISFRVKCPITIGTDNNSTYNTPFNNWYKNSWNECIYPKESFDSPCTINSISYDCSSACSYTCSSLKIYMGERSSATHSSNTDWTPIENLQLVYSASNVTIGNKTGWQNFTLETPFEYTKSGNLVVVVAKTAPSYTQTLKWESTSASNSCLYRQSDSDLSYANNPNGNSGTLYSYRANIKLTTSSVTSVNIGNETVSTYNTPFNNYYRNSWNECIYPKESFDSPCTINSISYDCSSAYSYTCSSLKIYMGERSSATHSSSTDWTSIENLQLVYSASNVTIGNKTGWQNFTLEIPFEYTKSGNLVVVVAKTAPSYTQTLKWESTSASNSCLYRQSDSDLSYANYPNSSSGTLSSYRANIRLSTTQSESIVIGNGDNSTYDSPFNNWYKNSWNECIYPKESFDSPCKINSISFDCASAYSYTCSSLKIYMGERSSATHSSNNDWTSIENLQLVYSASNVTIGDKTGWQNFMFDTPFEYTKSGNLVVVVAKTAPSYTRTLKWESTSASNSCLYRQSDSDLSYANHPSGNSGTLYNYRANIKLTTFPLHFDYEIIGDGNNSTYNTPFNNLWKNSWNECIYPKESFDSPCTINTVSYDCSSAYSYTCSSLKIYMGERSSATHSSNTDWTPISNLQLVYSASNVTIGNKTGWQRFVLDTPFEYSKSENLVIVVAKTAPSWTSSLQWNSTSVSNSCLYRQSDSDLSYANYPNGSSGTLSSYRANIRLSTTPSVNIGNGTVTYYTPFNNLYKNSWNECIYPKESFDSPCTINSISYDCSSAYSYTCSSLRIYMGERSSAAHSSSTDWTSIENLQLVYSASNVTIGDKTGWHKFVLDTPFEYSKSGNLVIVVAKTAPSWTSSLKWNSTSASNSCLYRQNDSYTSFAEYPNGNSGTLSSYRANILLKIVSNSVPSYGKSEEIDVIFGEDDSLSEVELDSDETMSVEETITDNVSIFPNPAHNFINIEMEDNNFEYVIYNELGQVVRQGSSCGKSQINVEDCHKGLYFIRIATGEKTSIHKIIIE